MPLPAAVPVVALQEGQRAGVEVGGERMLQEIKESDERRDKSKKERAAQALKLQ